MEASCNLKKNSNYIHAIFKILLDSHGRDVEHYRVNQTDDSKLTVDDKTHFDYLTQLVKVGRENIQRGDYYHYKATRKEGSLQAGSPLQFR